MLNKTSLLFDCNRLISISRLRIKAKSQSAVFSYCEAGKMIDVIFTQLTNFNPEDGSGMLLRNAGIYVQLFVAHGSNDVVVPLSLY